MTNVYIERANKFLVEITKNMIKEGPIIKEVHGLIRELKTLTICDEQFRDKTVSKLVDKQFDILEHLSGKLIHEKFEGYWHLAEN
jgi:hypothetical protein